LTGVLRLVAALWILVAIGAEAAAQTTTSDPKARCAQLLAYWDRYGVRRSEGGGGPGMTRLGAGIDCDKGRYDSGIKAMEELLRQNGYTVPPP
jgi:hypothetical protein